MGLLRRLSARGFLRLPALRSSCPLPGVATSRISASRPFPPCSLISARCLPLAASCFLSGVRCHLPAASCLLSSFSFLGARRSALPGTLGSRLAGLADDRPSSMVNGPDLGARCSVPRFPLTPPARWRYVRVAGKCAAWKWRGPRGSHQQASLAGTPGPSGTHRRGAVVLPSCPPCEGRKWGLGSDRWQRGRASYCRRRGSSGSPPWGMQKQPGERSGEKSVGSITIRTSCSPRKEDLWLGDACPIWHWLR